MKLSLLLKDTLTHHRLHLVSVGEEAHFSWSPCQGCGSTLGGDRHDCHLLGVNKKSGKVCVMDDSMAVCTDCLMEHCG